MPSQNWLEFLFPPSCSVCGQASADLLCPPCKRTLPWLEPTDAAHHASGPLDGIIAPVKFTDPVRSWILAFKYPPPGLFGQSASATGLVLWLARAGAERLTGARPDCITPVPSHPRRFQKRGFEPSYRLALEMARHRDIKLEPRLLFRVRDTPAQTGLKSSQREANVKNAFACRRRHLPHKACIWLVDDVVTTGSTLRSAARTLKQAGAEKVVGLCVARTGE